MIRRQAGQHISFYTLIYGYSYAVNAKNKIKYENPLMTHQLMFNSGHLLGRTAMRLVTKDGVGVAPVIQKLQPKKFIRIDKRSKKKLNFQSYGLSHVSSAKNAASATAFRKLGPNALYSVSIDYDYDRDIDNLGFRILAKR